MAKTAWKDNPKLDQWLLKPILIISVLLLAIAVQFQDQSAHAYTLIAFLTMLGYVGSKTSLGARVFVWQGLGSGKNIMLVGGVGVVVYAVIEGLGMAVGVPFAIGTSLALNIFYRWIAAVVLEEACFRSFLYPTFKAWLGNPISGAIVSSILWAGFHIVALRGDPDSIIFLILVGMVYSLVNERMKSSVPSYVAHGIRNFMMVVVGGG